jgi:hypothetical protein
MDGFRAPAKLTKFSKETGITAGTFGHQPFHRGPAVAGRAADLHRPERVRPILQDSWTHAFKLLR